MDKSPQNSSNSKSKRTPLGGGKRSRKRQCKDAAQARWQPKNADQQLSEMQVDNVVSEHVLAAHGDATVSSRDDLHAGQDNVPLPDEQPDKQCTARRKLDLMRKYVGEADDTDNDKERCFMEMRSLQSPFSAVACSECGGSLTVAFGDKMGYSREIRLACEVSLRTFVTFFSFIIITIIIFSFTKFRLTQVEFFLCHCHCQFMSVQQVSLSVHIIYILCV